MKPRLYFRCGYWICFTRDGFMRAAAAGLCPESAYRNWEAAYGR